MSEWSVLVGDVRERLKELPDQSVQCCVTSPPYWGLRDYGTAKWEGGDPACDHVKESKHQQQGVSSLRAGRSNVEEQRNETFKMVCEKCGAARIDNQIGLEGSPDAYVESLVSVFRGVKRVLKDDGTLWLNLGDTYARAIERSGSGPNGKRIVGDSTTDAARVRREVQGSSDGAVGRGDRAPLRVAASNLKPKDLVGIPWRVAFALQADGWYLRSDIIWAKPNPMPESVTDRPTKSHEYVFLLSKRERYYYDADAIAELASDAMLSQIEQGYTGVGIKDYEGAGVQNPSSVKARIIVNARKRADRFGGNKHNGDSTKHSDGSIYTGRPTHNARTVWTITTQPYPDAHFATFPEALPERCIKAGSRGPGKRCDCDEVIETPLGSGPLDDPTLQTGRAGMNRPRRLDEGTRSITLREQRSYAEQMKVSPHREAMATAAGDAFAHYIRTDKSGARPAPPDLLREWLARGWLAVPAPCGCPIEPGDLVLDPFTGSGTTGQVALQLGRRFVGVELNPTYAELARTRIGGAAPLFSQEVTQSLVATDDVDQTQSTQQGQLEW